MWLPLGQLDTRLLFLTEVFSEQIILLVSSSKQLKSSKKIKFWKFRLGSIYVLTFSTKIRHASTVLDRGISVDAKLHLLDSKSKHKSSTSTRVTSCLNLENLKNGRGGSGKKPFDGDREINTLITFIVGFFEKFYKIQFCSRGVMEIWALFHFPIPPSVKQQHKIVLKIVLTWEVL